MRIVSLAPSNTEILYALGMGRSIVGVTHFCDFPAGAQRKAKVGTWTSSHVDALQALKPDLILTSYYLPPELRAYDGPGELIHLEPRTVGGIFASIRQIGTLVGKHTAAVKLVDKLERELYTHMTAHTSRRGLPRVYAEEWGHPPMASGNWVPELISAAGGHAILMHPGEPSREVTADELSREDPDMIIMHWCGSGDRARVEDLTSRPGWSDLRAVRTGHVRIIHDSLLNRPGPRIVEGVLHLRRAIDASRAKGLHTLRKHGRVAN